MQYRLNRGWSRTPQNVSNVHEFEKSSIKLSYFKEEVTELKINKLKALNRPVAIVKACHSNGSHNLQMMLEDLSLYFTLQEEPDWCWLWVFGQRLDSNGASGTLVHFVYTNGQQPPCLPICVIIQFVILPNLHFKIIEEQGLNKSAKTAVSTFISNNKVVWENNISIAI